MTTPKIGPGALVVVVGPSGAGKDTLLALAHELYADTDAIVFPRRVVTRPSSAAEDHDSVSTAEFETISSAGGFAISWHAHGLSYGIPVAIDDAIRVGRTVVCNVSRGCVSKLHDRYQNCAVVLVTAPREILAARLAQRDRSEDRAERLDRPPPAMPAATLTIENTGTPQEGAEILAKFLRSCRMG
jgi:ribose 1,5-bisphosphokinase